MNTPSPTPQRSIQLRTLAGVSRRSPLGADGKIVTVLGANARSRPHAQAIRATPPPPPSSTSQGMLKFPATRFGPSPTPSCRRIVHVPEGREVFRSFGQDNLRGRVHAHRQGRQRADSPPSSAISLSARARHAPKCGQLSGGQQQMLAIARALLGQPALILMDEPSLGLSPKLTKEIFDIVVRINRERGVTILLVEQNAHMALKIADFGYVLEVGRIVMEDTGARLAEKDDIKEFYLGMKAAGARGARRWKKKKLWR